MANQENSSGISDRVKGRITLAFSVALWPALWAVLATYLIDDGANVAAASLVAASVYAANGFKVSDALKITIGLLLGLVFSLAVMWFVLNSGLPLLWAVFIALFVLAGLLVIIGDWLDKIIHLAAALCGLATSLLVWLLIGFDNPGVVSLWIAISFLVGVFYIGMFLFAFNGWLLGLWSKK